MMLLNFLPGITSGVPRSSHVFHWIHSVTGIDETFASLNDNTDQIPRIICGYDGDIMALDAE